MIYLENMAIIHSIRGNRKVLLGLLQGKMRFKSEFYSVREEVLRSAFGGQCSENLAEGEQKIENCLSHPMDWGKDLSINFH